MILRYLWLTAADTGVGRDHGGSCWQADTSLVQLPNSSCVRRWAYATLRQRCVSLKSHCFTKALDKPKRSGMIGFPEIQWGFAAYLIWAEKGQIGRASGRLQKSIRTKNTWLIDRW